MSKRVSTVEIELRKRLKALFDDWEFINGILVYARDERDRQTLLEFIDAGDDVSVETVTVLALELCDARKITG